MGLSAKKKSLLVLFYTVLLLFQVSASVRYPNMPDISFIAVIFAGIYVFEPGILFLMAVIALVRDIFSPGTLVADLILFPFLCFLSYVFARMFNRDNLVFQVFITFVCLIILMAGQLFCISAEAGNWPYPGIVTGTAWNRIVLTCITGPFFIVLYKSVLRVKD